jgi:hypothetical protein
LSWTWQAVGAEPKKLPSMKRIALLPLVAVLALPASGAAAPSDVTATSAKGPHFEGTVVSVNRSARTFRLRDVERGTVRIRVTSSTRFERIAGFSALRAGMRDVEAKVRRSGGRWVAIEVERSGTDD